MSTQEKLVELAEESVGIIKEVINRVEEESQIANVNYNNKDNKRVINPLDSRFNLSTLKVNRLELWKISNTRRETLIQTYPLKDF